jgi:hypothetical protein
VNADGVAGVDGQVHDRRLKLATVSADRRQVAAIVGGQLDVLIEHAAQQHLELADHLPQVEDLALDRLFAREGQQLADEVCGADRRLLDLVQAFIGGVADRMACVQHVQLHEDRCQQVVEVMSDAARQLADGLHLLALGQLQFDLLLVRHVDHIGDPASGALR